MRYEWGRRLARIEADVVGGELERIRSVNGQLKPRDVVDEARPKTSPIHGAFEWNNKTAGEKYRIHQARNLIRAVRVVVDEDEGEESITVPAFVHIDKGHDEKYYQSSEIAVQNVDEFVLAVKGLAKKLSGAQRALDELQSMADERGADTAALLSVAAASLVVAHDAIARVN